MLRKFQLWPQAIVEEVGAAVSYWQAVKQGALDAFWPTAPRKLTRYSDEIVTAQMLTARAFPVTRKG